MNKEENTLLSSLAKAAIDRLKSLQKPIVRVCGPLTSGGFGYEENLRRFKIAETVLKEKGLTVFDYFESNDDEEKIVAAKIPWEMVMEYYHKPILEANLIDTAYFMPKWQESNGSKWEHDFITTRTTTQIVDLPEEWLK